MALFEDTNAHDLKGLLRQVDAGVAALPDFQRDFVWDPSATQELIVSIAKNYPAGSLLRIRNTHNLFKAREFQGATPLSSPPTYLVLDGQQRLTSLYQAFYGVGDHRYFVRVRALLDGDDFEECIFHLRANLKRTRNLSIVGNQARELIMPLSVLKDGYGGFLRWAMEIARLHENDQRMEFLNQLTNTVGSRWIQAIDDYLFPVVTLSDETNAEAVCTIFETLNRTGVRLSAFELLTARFWPKNVSLRELWGIAQQDHPIVAEFDVDAYYLMQIIALIARPFPSCRRGDVLALDVQSVEEWWDRAVLGLERALELLRDECGVLIPKFLPYNTIVVPLAAALAPQLSLVGPAYGSMLQKLRRWYWCSVFGQTYESAANSQAARDVTELRRWFVGGEPPESVSSLRFDPFVLRDTTPNQRAVYRGTISLVLSRNTRDFHKTTPISAQLIREQEIDDHHVFPVGFLWEKYEEIPYRLRDCVLNRTLIDRRTNIRIGARPPSDYMGEIRNELGSSQFDALLASHSLPSGPDSPFWTDDFLEFLSWRQASIWGLIKEVTGLTQPTDLMDEEIEDESA